jgi:uncharacterized SAM-binding protein YcdF (DUF218 family)
MLSTGAHQYGVRDTIPYYTLLLYWLPDCNQKPKVSNGRSKAAILLILTQPFRMVPPKMETGSRKRKPKRERTTTPALPMGVVAISTMGFFALVIAILLFANVKEQGKVKKQKVFSDATEIPTSTLRSLDAILVLGGGRPSKLDEPPEYVQGRCDDAAAVVRRRMSLGNKENKQPLPILCLSAGTAHMPQLLSADGLPIWESTATAAYLEKQHGLIDNVFVETTSYDTIGNAFFARTSHTDVTGWRNLLIITNKASSFPTQ